MYNMCVVQEVFFFKNSFFFPRFAAHLISGVLEYKTLLDA